MNYYVSPGFVKTVKAMPKALQRTLFDKYDAMKADPAQISAHVKQCGNLWSAQLNSDWRLLGVSVNEGILWFWIGPRKRA